MNSKISMNIMTWAVAGLLMGMQANAVAGDAAAGEAKTAMCAGCHMPDGNSVVDMFPKLAGQGEAYIVKQLADFKAGKRTNDTMAPMAMAVADEDMADIGAFYAKQVSTPVEATESNLALGKDVYRGGNILTGVPACMGCHGPTGRGNAPAKYPSLGGQHATYIKSQLNAFRDGSRNNDPNGMMRSVVAQMSAAEMEAVANYIATLK
ncbi:MAG TPA: c-type cytochrome [Gammaproteobacteria bacterium]|nr:c-type cytochrome [Gammaproteobacteria bacterium]